jgi:rubrerythrin
MKGRDLVPLTPERMRGHERASRPATSAPRTTDRRVQSFIPELAHNLSRELADAAEPSARSSRTANSRSPSPHLRGNSSIAAQMRDELQGYSQVRGPSLGSFTGAPDGWWQCHNCKAGGYLHSEPPSRGRCSVCEEPKNSSRKVSQPAPATNEGPRRGHGAGFTPSPGSGISTAKQTSIDHMLESMGFTDADKNAALMRKHNHQLDKVLDELISGIGSTSGVVAEDLPSLSSKTIVPRPRTPPRSASGDFGRGNSRAHVVQEDRGGLRHSSEGFDRGLSEGFDSGLADLFGFTCIQGAQSARSLRSAFCALSPAFKSDLGMWQIARMRRLCEISLNSRILRKSTLSRPEATGSWFWVRGRRRRKEDF